MTVYVDDLPQAIRRREQQREATRRYREKHRDRVRENARKRYAADPERHKKKHGKWFQKIKDDPAFKSKAQSDARRCYRPRSERQIAEVTGGKPKPATCEVCNGSATICLDHCHESHFFRGWLCHHCNLILGHAKDDATLLRKLADYLENRGRA